MFLKHSIQNAYIETIRNSQHFVYIENQFFSKLLLPYTKFNLEQIVTISTTVTSTSDQDEDFILKNQIGAALVNRIKRAHEENTAFRVIVVMPLIPAFPADLSSKDAGVARWAVLNW